MVMTATASTNAGDKNATSPVTQPPRSFGSVETMLPHATATPSYLQAYAQVADETWWDNFGEYNNDYGNA